MSLKNKAEQVKGKVKEGAGEATDDESMKLKGKVENLAGQAKDKAEEVKDKAAEKVNDFMDKKDGE
ncbi:CsbD family protein [Lentilactobacillus sp. Marseille-Q4993]|uniref:CsbD family protein n=1 Tax=Lentilactobacillus sp. Marseille-Q4993 TaxID=3039492 RepID=UPI0024BD3A8E|nr:CsbD family protein [Lentilactobacillus sp. Marseille-Q4993]